MAMFSCIRRTTGWSLLRERSSASVCAVVRLYSAGDEPSPERPPQKRRNASSYMQFVMELKAGNPAYANHTIPQMMRIGKEAYGSLSAEEKKEYYNRALSHYVANVRPATTTKRKSHSALHNAKLRFSHVVSHLGKPKECAGSGYSLFVQENFHRFYKPSTAETPSAVSESEHGDAGQAGEGPPRTAAAKENEVTSGEYNRALSKGAVALKASAAAWKALSQSEREDYVARQKELREQNRSKITQWWKALPLSDRRRVDEAWREVVYWREAMPANDASTPPELIEVFGQEIANQLFLEAFTDAKRQSSRNAPWPFIDWETGLRESSSSATTESPREGREGDNRESTKEESQTKDGQ